MVKLSASEAIDLVLEDADVHIMIEDIGEYIHGGYSEELDLELLEMVASAGRALNTASRLPLANPVPRDLGFFLLAWAAERMVEWDYDDGDDELGRIGQAIEEVEKTHGLKEDQFFTPGDGPVEWEELNEKFVQRINKLTVQHLMELGQVSMADSFEQDPEEFYERREAGAQQLDTAIGVKSGGENLSIH